MSTHEPDKPQAARPAWRTLWPVGSMATVATFLPPVGGLVILGTLPILGEWLQGLGWLGLGLFVVGFVVLAGLALLPTFAQAALAGWAFGVGWGFAGSMVGFAGASLLAHRLADRVAGGRLVEVIDARPRWRAVRQELVGSGFWRSTVIVTLLRLPPTSPFALTNVLLASAQVPRAAYFVGTVLGLAPRTGAAVFAAAGLAQLSVDRPAPGNLAIAFTVGSTLLATLVLGWFARRALRRMVFV